MASRIGAGSISRRLSERARATGPTGIGASSGDTTDLFGRLRQMVDQITEAVSAASREAASSQDHTGADARAGGRIVFGYNVSMGLDGLRMEPFGDVAPAQAGSSPAQAGTRRKDTTAQPAPASRAPIVDIFEEDGAVTIIAELPGVSDADISCRLSGLDLHIETAGRHRYAKTVRLPWLADAASQNQTCRNGILEIRLTRAAAP